MTIEYITVPLQVPRPLFAIGDFVEVRESYRQSGFLIIGQVHFRRLCGTFEFVGDMPVSRWDNAESEYWLACQIGSFSAPGSPIRPGILIYFSVEELHEFGRLVDYDGQVTSADTPDNAWERIERYEAQRQTIG